MDGNSLLGLVLLQFHVDLFTFQDFSVRAEVSAAQLP